MCVFTFEHIRKRLFFFVFMTRRPASFHFYLFPSSAFHFHRQPSPLSCGPIVPLPPLPANRKPITRINTPPCAHLHRPYASDASESWRPFPPGKFPAPAVSHAPHPLQIPAPSQLRNELQIHSNPPSPAAASSSSSPSSSPSTRWPARSRRRASPLAARRPGSSWRPRRRASRRRPPAA
jgi:hypothetical protein